MDKTLIRVDNLAVPGGSNKSSVSKVICNIDFDEDGKQFGSFQVPATRNTSAWGRIVVPMIQIKNGDGPTFLMTGGLHGDEYEGPVALSKLVQRLKPEQIHGRVIIIPAVNLPAHYASTRLSPSDNLDMNRSFPGEKHGTSTKVITHFLEQVVLPKCDYVLDIHSGGKSLDFVSSVVFHRVEDKEQQKKIFSAARDFGAPYGILIEETDSDVTFDTAAESRGKIFLSTELRGAGSVNRLAVEIADNGIRNLLKHIGMADVRPSKYTSYRSKKTQILVSTPDEKCFIVSSEDGLLEFVVDLGDEVKEGQTIAQVHFISNLSRRPKVLKASIDGILICKRAPGRVESGDCIGVIGVEQSWEDL